jgi:bifunctional oligoribonuclease and PAP phosphatase NrnA
MALTHEQQAVELVTRAKRILLTTREHATPDALASVAALLLFLKKLNKPFVATVPGFDLAKAPAFLPGTPDIQASTGAMRAFEFVLDVTQTTLSELYYDVRDGKLTVSVIPQSGEWTPKDVSFRSGEDRYDLVIALDCPDMASTGELFRDHADFLYRTPVINIDRDPGNEHWGQLNLVDLTAVSTTEILYNLFDGWNRNFIDADIATALLTGMISKTQSFRSMNVTPKTLQTASQLIALGGRREEIVHGLWRTKTVPTLKLWGRALSRLEQDKRHNLVWTILTRHDFLESGTDDRALEGIVSELVSYAPEAKISLLVHEPDDATLNGACVTIHVSPPFSAQEIGRVFGAQGTRERVTFRLAPGKPLREQVDEVIQKIQEVLGSVKEG